MPFCSICKVHCPSDYQMKEHLSGRKHAEVIKFGGQQIKGICFQFQNTGYCSNRAFCTYKHITATMTISPVTFSTSNLSAVRSGVCPPGYCYLWWNNGVCSKGAKCTYKHDEKVNEYANDDSYSSDDSIDYEQFDSPKPIITTSSRVVTNLITPQSLKRSSDDLSEEVITSEFLIFKKGHLKSTPSKTPKLAPIFCKPVKKVEEPPRFSEKYKNLFYRKRDVNLYIKNGLVVWEFSYDKNVIDAIKENIKGRAWNPNIGIKGCWTNPIESLPDAIELYEFMGRTASNEIKKRAEEIKSQYKGASPSDTIQVKVKIFIDKLKKTQDCYIEDQSQMGSVVLKFFYDAQIIEALKELPPLQRNYDPTTKFWEVDLFTLNDLLESLDRKGFEADDSLKELSSYTRNINDLMFKTNDVSEDSKSNRHVIDLSFLSLDNNKKEDDLSIGENTWDTSPKKNEDNLSLGDNTWDTSSKKSEDDLSTGDNTWDTSPKKKEDDHSSGDNTWDTSPKKKEDETIVLNEEEQVLKLEKMMKDMIDHVVSNNNDNKHISDKMLSSDCGSSKRNKISTLLYRKSSWIDSLDGLSLFASKTFKSWKQNHVPTDCDCGRPEIRHRGVHTCRYFGTFVCQYCGNNWTSAYCWKGEKQACRCCEAESLPIETRPLERGLGVVGGGEHDSARCGRCRSLGYNCNSYF